MLHDAIEQEKKRRPAFRVTMRSGHAYMLESSAVRAGMILLYLEFYELNEEPERGDVLYFSENLAEGLQDNLHMYSFSTEIGSPCAREPHDFLIDPREFLILEYAHGETILLEQQYG